MAVHTSAGKRRRVASPVSADLDSSSPVTWRTVNVSRTKLEHSSVVWNVDMHEWAPHEKVTGVGNPPMMDNCTHFTNAFQQIWSRLLTFKLHYQAVTNLLNSLPGEKHVYQIGSDHLYKQGERGGYSKGTVLMDNAHFLLLCNRDHPVRAGARADGGFVCVWIRIGEVLFYSFSVTAQEKGKRRWDGKVQTEWWWKAEPVRALFHSVITGVLKVPKLRLPSPTSVFALTH